MASRREATPARRMRRIALVTQWDKVETFLMYDMDVPAVNEKLMACKAQMLLSNPCFEIWILLHVRDQKSPVSTDALLKELKKSSSLWKNYSKTAFTDTQIAFLKRNMKDAVLRSKSLREFSNPSTGVYKLIELLEE